MSRATVLAAVLCVSSLFPGAAHAKSLQEFEAMPAEQQGKYLSDFVLKMKTDMAAKNPELANAIWVYFTHDVPGKPTTQGVEDLMVQEMVVDKLAQQGKADPSKIQIEGMIVYVVKQHFKA